MVPAAMDAKDELQFDHPWITVAWCYDSLV